MNNLLEPKREDINSNLYEFMSLINSKEFRQIIRNVLPKNYQYPSSLLDDTYTNIIHVIAIGRDIWKKQ